MGDATAEPIAGESSSSQPPPDDLQCTICLSAEFAQECRVNGCNHSFCFSCISEWVTQSIRPSCPMCRHEIQNILYDFTEQVAKKEISIKEYRSTQMSISPADRALLIGERRLIVRNLMHCYKLLTLLGSEISELNESKEGEETAKTELRKLEEIVSSHILNAEKSLSDLRTDVVHNNKSLVFNTLTFRRIVYTNKIKVKYPDQKKKKLRPRDISRDPNRFKNMIINFLLSEFEAIPYQNQPKIAGHKWRTKFLGGTIDTNQKQRYADDIFQLMLSTATGTEDFQRDLGDILTPVSSIHIQFLDDHLDAIIATEKNNIEDFYQEVYYDSIYNSFPNSFFDYNAMLNMREDPQLRFEAIFNQIHPFDFLDPFGPRVIRQQADTDRATNNDNDSDRSSSPEERTPTPMPDDQFVIRGFGTGEELVAPTSFVYRPLSIRRVTVNLPSRAQVGDHSSASRDPPSSSSTSHMTLRSSTRRDREREQNSEAASGPSSSTDPETMARQARRRGVQRFENTSRALSRRLQGPLQPQTVSLAEFLSRPPPEARPMVPVYHPTTRPTDREAMPRFPFGYNLATLGHAHSNPALEAYLSEPTPSFTFIRSRENRRDQRRRSPSPIPAPPEETEEPEQTDQEAAEQIAAAINQEDADNGLDFISVARRTRAARRAAEATPSGAPPPKRTTTSRRRRR